MLTTSAASTFATAFAETCLVPEHGSAALEQSQVLHVAWRTLKSLLNEHKSCLLPRTDTFVRMLAPEAMKLGQNLLFVHVML
jgi:hypothetical protein